MKRVILLFFVCVLLVGSCTPTQPVEMPTETLIPTDALVPSKTSAPTRTSSPSRTPAPTMTPKPSLTATITTTAVPPLAVNKWQPKTVLVKFESKGGDGCCLYSYPPDLVLYANGRIIVSQYFKDNDGWRYQPMTKVYPRGELCSILNTIDQTGYLYYNPRSYQPQGSDYFSTDGGPYVFITVNAWKSNHGEFYGLDFYSRLYNVYYQDYGHLINDPGTPIILPALRDVYYFLETFSPNDVEIYQSQRLGLIVTRNESAVVKSETRFIDWPFNDISLSKIETITTKENFPNQYFIVEGNLAVSIYEYFGNSFGDYGENVRQDGQEYVVFLRPFLPYELPQLRGNTILPDPGVKSPGFELECYPSDGILPIPTPAFP